MGIQRLWAPAHGLSLLGLVGGVLLACTTSPPLPHIRLPACTGVHVALPQASVVLLRTVDRRGRGLTSGVGFAVGDGGWLVTAAHVVHGAARVQVASAACGSAELDAATVQRAPGGDVALLRLPWRLPPLRVAAAAPADGTPVMLVGDAGGLGRIEVSDGVWRNDVDGRGVLATWAAPGVSGSPVVADGAVVGMVVAGVKAPSPRTLALPAVRFAPWLQLRIAAP